VRLSWFLFTTHRFERREADDIGSDRQGNLEVSVRERSRMGLGKPFPSGSIECARCRIDTLLAVPGGQLWITNAIGCELAAHRIN